MNMLKDYEKHIKDVRTTIKTGEMVAYCGADLYKQFHFEDASHAVCARQDGSRLLPCPDCKKIVIDLLNSE